MSNEPFLLPAKRPRCHTCCRPMRTCLCALTVPVATATEVVIWQHPSEQDHPKGSARLLHLCLPNSRIVVGEQITPAALDIDPLRCALLYPSAGGEAARRRGGEAARAAGSVDQLLLLDGTWRKSRRMYYLNPWLQDLPRLSLAAVESAYRVRRAEQRYQLSTFEAAVLALQTLEPGTATAPLERVFSGFVQQLLRFRPRQ